MTEFEEKVGSFILGEGLFADCKKVLLAVSGGVDSVALVHVMTKVVDAEIVIAHVNHNLRGCKSDADQHFVADMAERLGIELICESLDVTGFAKANALSIETAARLLRMDAMCRFASNLDCDAVVTGHHKDDNAETIVHRIMRGTGFKGLGGIKPERTLNGTVFVSPMLCVRRKEIVEYARQNEIGWREDHTNADCDITRNKIRHLLIPLLETNYTGKLADDLGELSARCRCLYKKIEQRVEALKIHRISTKSEALNSKQILSSNFENLKQLPDWLSINLNQFISQHKLVQVEIIRRALEAVGCGLKFIKAEHYDAVIGLCYGAGGRKIELPGGFVAKREYDEIKIVNSKSNRKELIPAFAGMTDSNKPSDRHNIENIKRLSVGGNVEFDGYRVTTKVLNASQCDIEEFIKTKDSFVEWFDLDSISGDIIVRRRKNGDKFYPIGAGGKKKVGKFITTVKIACNLREKLLVFEDVDKIFWLCPVRASEKTKVSGETKKILQILVSEAF